MRCFGTGRSFSGISVLCVFDGGGEVERDLRDVDGPVKSNRRGCLDGDDGFERRGRCF